jgi:hypothetical protein
MKKHLERIKKSGISGDQSLFQKNITQIYRSYKRNPRKIINELITLSRLVENDIPEDVRKNE